MNGRQSKEQRRNLKNTIVAQAADAVAELRNVVGSLQLQHQVLAKEMQSLRIANAAAVEARAVDLQSMRKLGAEILETRAYVDAREKAIAEWVEARRRSDAELLDELLRKVARLERTPWRRFLDWILVKPAADRAPIVGDGV